MLRFPFRGEIPDCDPWNRYQTNKLRLNNEWEIVCLSERKGYSEILPLAIKICRVVTSDEMLVTGTLSLTRYEQTVSMREFSKLMKSGSSFVMTDLSNQQRKVKPKALSSSNYFLSGVVFVAPSIDFEDGKCIRSIQPKLLLNLSNDLERLLDPQTSYLSDVNLKCGAALIPAHKNILSARSPVFAAMFSNQMKENHENQVDIIDMDASVLKALVIFIYTGKIPNLTVQSASNLLFAAEKYQLLDLKKVCCDFLKKNVSLENVLWILILGDMYAEDMKSFALNCICNRFCSTFSVLENTEMWKSLRKDRPALAMDVLTAFLKSREQETNVQLENPGTIQCANAAALVTSREHKWNVQGENTRTVPCSNNAALAVMHMLQHMERVKIYRS